MTYSIFGKQCVDKMILSAVGFNSNHVVLGLASVPTQSAVIHQWRNINNMHVGIIYVEANDLRVFKGPCTVPLRRMEIQYRIKMG